MNRDPWNERFGFFWYNDDEIFRFTDEDFKSRAKALGEAGTNHVITFSCTHFRWSFRRYWNELNTVLRRLVEACHAYDIAVTEHHSSHLTFNPLDKDDEGYMERVLNKRGSTIRSWPSLREDCDADSIINGKPLSSFRQIDGRTGEWARSRYRGWCMCFNNPDFRSAYLEYLESVYETGVDGIMTDDVQYFALENGPKPGHACACEHCRRLFSEQTGYELPKPGDPWNNWHGDYDDQSFLAWIRFRIESVRRFHEIVAEHYESLGKRLLRPNYQSGVLNANPTAYCLEDLPRLDWIFQENCNSDIIRYSWPMWAAEAAHRYAVGRTRSIPPMSLFYPDRDDMTRFSWALAMSWGHLYLGTSEGRSVAELEKPLRDFEVHYENYVHDTVRIPDVAFYYSRESRVLDENAPYRSLSGLITWAQSCCRRNIPFTIFRKEDITGTAQNDAPADTSGGEVGQARVGNGGDDVPILVVNDVVFLDDEEIEGFKRYLLSGGTLVWTGFSGSRRLDGSNRGEHELGDLLGVAEFTCSADGAEENRYIAGAGRLVTLPGNRWIGPYLTVLRADRWHADSIRTTWGGDPTKEVRNSVASCIDDLLEDRWSLRTFGFAEDALFTYFKRNDGPEHIVHYVNAAQTLEPAADNTIGHEDPVPFPELSGGTITVNLQRGAVEDTGSSVPAARRVVLYDPEHEEPSELTANRDGDTLQVELEKPPRYYGLIVVE